MENRKQIVINFITEKDITTSLFISEVSESEIQITEVGIINGEIEQLCYIESLKKAVSKKLEAIGLKVESPFYDYSLVYNSTLEEVEAALTK